MSKPIEWVHEDADGNEIITHFPSRWVLCDRCRGEGVHDCFPGGITSSEWEHEWDFDERERYLDGGYDTTCEECHGEGKVRVLDEDTIERHTALRATYEKYLKHLKSEAEYNNICEWERKMGA